MRPVNSIHLPAEVTADIRKGQGASQIALAIVDLSVSQKNDFKEECNNMILTVNGSIAVRLLCVCFIFMHLFTVYIIIYIYTVIYLTHQVYLQMSLL